jgi:hypothetical protein
MRIHTRLTSILTLAVILVAGLAGKPAQASLAPDNPVVTAHGSDFTFLYDAALSGSEKVVSGDFLTIAGIHDYVSGSVFNSAGFTSTVSTAGGVTDITWMATGAKGGPAGLDFGFLSTISKLGLGSYAYSDHSKAGQILSGSGTVQVPAAITPEPASIMSLGLSGLVLLALMLLGRARRVRDPKRILEAYA